jgi:tetratricopeptide (TPR) repeat protein
MQTQDAPAEFIFKLWPWFEANRNRIIAVAAALVVALAVYFFISSQKAQNEINAGKALTQLLMSPASSAETLLKIAQEYPGTAAGKRAQLQGAATLFGAGRYADAQAQFQKIIDASTGGSSKTFAATAQAGLAASLEAQGKVKEAVAAYQKVVSGFAGSPSVGTAEFALGRLSEQQGQLAEAVSHYENAARASVGGSLASEASVRASELKAKLALAAKPAAKS